MSKWSIAALLLAFTPLSSRVFASPAPDHIFLQIYADQAMDQAQPAAVTHWHIDLRLPLDKTQVLQAESEDGAAPQVEVRATRAASGTIELRTVVREDGDILSQGTLILEPGQRAETLVGNDGKQLRMKFWIPNVE